MEESPVLLAESILTNQTKIEELEDRIKNLQDTKAELRVQNIDNVKKLGALIGMGGLVKVQDKLFYVKDNKLTQAKVHE